MTDPLRGLLGNAMRTSVASGSMLLLVALLIFAGRLLGDEAYGRFSFALALAMIFETLVDFGLKEITTREAARDPATLRNKLANTFGLKLVLAVAAGFAFVVTVRALTSDPDVRVACYLLGMSSILRSYLLTLRHTLQGLERFGADSVAVVIDRVLLLLLGGGALLAGLGLFGISAAFVAARAVSLAAAYGVVAWLVGPVRPAFDVAAWRALQFGALPFGAFALALSFYSYIDTIMLGVLRGDAETGLYNAAYRIYEGVANVPQLLYNVLAPRLASMWVVDRLAHRRLARRGLLFGLVLGAPVAGCTFVFAPVAVTTLFGVEYAAAGAALQLLGAGVVFVLPLFVLYSVALSVDAGGRMLSTVLIGCIVNIGLNGILIPRYGMLGAAAATVVGEAAVLTILAWGLRRYL